MPTMLEVMESRLGIEEIRGPKHNPIIVGWFNDVGWGTVKDDETAYCSACMGSAAKEADMPMPPHNTRLMARSWLTWGVKVAIGDIQPGDVAIWPRGDPKGWQGHVNIVKEVTVSGKVKCIGANQEHGIVSVTKALDPKGALGFRRGVPATVGDLRKAGSTTINAADNKEKMGIAAVFITPIVEGFRYLFGPVEVPKFATLPDGLTWWQSVLGGANAVLDYAIAHPYLAATLIVGLGLWGLSRMEKADRVAEHASGIPIAAELADLEPA